MRTKRRGFTLVEMMVVTSIIGIILAIAIPSLTSSVQKAKQKRTMGDMRTIASALESYAIDYNAYPVSAAGITPVLYGGLSYPTATLAAGLSNYISPTYIRIVPLRDGWNSWFLSKSVPKDYALVSPGKDGVASSPATSGPTSSFNEDIVFSDGHFTVYPEGSQK